MRLSTTSLSTLRNSIYGNLITTVITNIFIKTKEDTYDYFDEDNLKDPVMGEFCKYMVETFSNGRPWFEEKDRKRICKVEIKLLKAIKTADYEKYAFEHIDEVERKIGQMHIIEIYKKKLGIKD